MHVLINVKILISTGIHVDSFDEQGNTTLHIACVRENAERLLDFCVIIKLT